MATLSTGTKVRRAAALVVTFEDSEILATNYLQSKTFACNAQAIEVLAGSEDWRSVADVCAELDHYSADSVAAALSDLVDVGGLVVEDSPEASADAAYAGSWEWGHVAGLFHFGSRNPNFMTREEAEAYLAERASLRRSPQTYKKNSDEALVLPAITEPDAVLSAMLCRRSVRAFRDEPISTAHLAEVLFSGLGILGYFEHPNLGTMPITLTPSGGARNPFEAYVYVRKVEEMDAGIYHYSALQTSLEPCGSGPWPEPREMLPEQVWVDDAAAIVFLVADFDRTMWKYGEAFAYKTILIEAGHIAQNMAVTCAKHGLVANPTLGIHDDRVEKAIGVSPPLVSAIYALSIGYPDASVHPYEEKGDKASF